MDREEDRPGVEPAPHREVERKFLVAAVPPGIAWDDALDLRQGYLALDGDTEVRLRFL